MAKITHRQVGELSAPASSSKRLRTVVTRFLREKTVLAVSAGCALVTMCFVPPDAAYVGYFDLKVLACLLSILAIVSALRNVGAFDALARRLVAHLSSCRTAVMMLVAVTLVLSMVVTNDMALIMMLPLSTVTLLKAGWGRQIPFTFIMQNMAANLGGMIVPFGNPQNLYLFAEYSVSLGDFLSTMLVPFATSCVLIFACCFVRVKPTAEDENAVRAHREARRRAFDRRNDRARVRLASVRNATGQLRRKAGALVLHPGERRMRALLYAALLVLVVLAVFRVVPYALAPVAVFGVLLFADRSALRSVDYSLILTFACFFVFSGNMARIPEVVGALSWLLDQSVLAASAGLSQIISNVPAAILLSHLTGDWPSLLVGVNVGGAGTPVASLATLITLAHYRLALDVHAGAPGFERQSVGRFFLQSTAWGFGFLAVLLAVCWVCGF